jgi:hypothetical protein
MIRGIKARGNSPTDVEVSFYRSIEHCREKLLVLVGGLVEFDPFGLHVALDT